MAGVITTFTSAADVEEVVPTELIDNFVQNFEYTPPVGLAIAWAKAGKGTIVVRFARWGSAAGIAVPAGTKTEADQFTDVEHDTAENSITPGFVGFRMPVSDEMQLNSLDGVPAGLIMEALLALDDRIDSDVLSSSTAATNTAGSVTRVYSLTEFRNDLSTYRALRIPRSRMGHAMVLHENGTSELLESLGSTAALFAKQEGDTLGVGTELGFQGSQYGVAVYSSQNTPVEGAGHSGSLTPIGAQASGLGVVMPEAPNIRPTRGDDAELHAVDYMVVRSLYGSGLTNPRRLLEILHK